MQRHKRTTRQWLDQNLHERDNLLMMKSTLSSLLSFLFFMGLAHAGPVADYQIEKGKLHTGGSARVEVLESSAEKFVAKLNYQIQKKILVPIPEDQLKGETVFEFPPEFRDERGYLELETKGTMEMEKAKIQFLKRVNWKGHKNAYQILILPSNGRSKVEVIYHPSIKAAGWGKILVTFINSVPIFNGYQVDIEIVN